MAANNSSGGASNGITFGTHRPMAYVGSSSSTPSALSQANTTTAQNNAEMSGMRLRDMKRKEAERIAKEKAAEEAGPRYTALFKPMPSDDRMARVLAAMGYFPNVMAAFSAAGALPRKG